MKLNRASFVFAALCVLASSAHGATYFVPSDREMIQRSDDIVVAAGVTSVSEHTERGGIVTRYTLRIEEVVKGKRSAGSHLVLTELGGVVGGEARLVPGAPEYAPGQRYLVFTETNRHGDPITFGLSLGQFALVEANGRLFAVRDHITGFDQNLESHVERARDARAFIDYIRSVVTQQSIAPAENYFVDDAPSLDMPKEDEPRPWRIEALAFSRNSYLMTSGGNGFRWQSPSATIVTSGTHSSLNGSSAVSTAISEWNSTASSISYGNGGQDNTAVKGLTASDGKNAVLYGDPNGEVPSGVAGIGGISSAIGTYSLDGETFWNTGEVDVVIAASGITHQSCLNSVMTHEIGHTLGFRHSDQNCSGSAECSSAAIMTATTKCSYNGVLQAWDENAAATVYGSGTVCTPPSITTQPASRTITAGTTTQLSVSVSGTSPFSYQWYIGSSGSTSQPIAGATGSSVSVTPSTTTSYWVRVTNSCPSGTVDSTTATVTVSTSTCTAPSITSQPPNRSITAGSSTSLSVSASGTTPLAYQWYIGSKGNTSLPIAGATSASIGVSPSTTTSYWVRVSNACGTADSNTATVTVTTCTLPSITQQPQDQTIAHGGTTTISVSASGAESITWYRAAAPNKVNQVGTGTSLTVGPLTATTQYWAALRNSCGEVATRTVTITVGACALPSITQQPQDQTINSGSTATLSVGVSSGSTVTWYRGMAPDTRSQAGTGTSLTVGPLTQTTHYWAVVRNSCGEVQTRTATITVNPVSDLLWLLNGRFAVQVHYRNQFVNPPVEGKLIGRSLSSSSISETAIFWFNDPNVTELMVRLSDARPFDNHIHVFLGGLSDVEFTVVVADSLTGKVMSYPKPPNQIEGKIDRTSFVANPNATTLQSSLDAVASQTSTLFVTPLADSSTLRLLNNRYQVRMRYVNQFENPPTTGYLLGRSIASSSVTETAVFYFTNPESVEWMVRFSDARPFDNHIHFFHGGLSDVEFTIEVTDTLTGLYREYHKPMGSLKGAVDRTTWVP